MSHKRTRLKKPNVEPDPVPVPFKFLDPTATSVSIAGTFNEWNPDSEPLTHIGCGHWLGEVALPPGEYEYCLIVDGQWRPDPAARENLSNPFGGLNSVLKVAASAEAGHRADAGNLPMISANN